MASSDRNQGMETLAILAGFSIVSGLLGGAALFGGRGAAARSRSLRWSRHTVGIKEDKLLGINVTPTYETVRNDFESEYPAYFQDTFESFPERVANNSFNFIKPANVGYF